MELTECLFFSFRSPGTIVIGRENHRLTSTQHQEPFRVQFPNSSQDALIDPVAQFKLLFPVSVETPFPTSHLAPVRLPVAAQGCSEGG